MSDSDLFQAGLKFFNSGMYFQAHEVWEDLWRATDGRLKLFYQGLIQAAVGLHHWQRNNPVGTRGQLTKAIQKLSAFGRAEQGIDVEDLIRQLTLIREGMPLE